MEKIGWTDRVTNKEVLHTVKEDGKIVHTTNGRKADWIGHCVREYVIEGKIERRIEVRGRRRRRCKQLLNGLKEKIRC